MGEPFKVGDAVYLVLHGNMGTARPGVVKSVYKTGNFTLEGVKGQFRRDGGCAGDDWNHSKAYPITPELTSEIVEARHERRNSAIVYRASEQMRCATGDKRTAIAALLSDELLALLGVTR